MKNLLSNKSLATLALLILLSLSAFASMTMLVNAAKPIKDDNVFIDGSGSVVLTWKSGKTQTYTSNGYASLGGLDTITFIPTRGWHIGSVFIDGDNTTIVDEDGFSLTGVKVRTSISVSFVANNGMDEVGTGANVESYPTPYVFLNFTNVETGGEAFAYDYSGLEIYIPPPPDPNLNETLDIYTSATVVFENVTVILVVSLDDCVDAGVDPQSLRLWGADIEVALADVNMDGVVNGDDVSDVGNANPSEPGDPLWDPRLDVYPLGYPDGVINDDDVNFVNDYSGLFVWEDITVDVIVDYDAGVVYVLGETEHFSLFHGF